MYFLNNQLNPTGASSGNTFISYINEIKMTDEQRNAFFLHQIEEDGLLKHILHEGLLDNKLLLNGGKITYDYNQVESDLVEGGEANARMNASQNSQVFGEICFNIQIPGITKITGEQVQKMGKGGLQSYIRDLEQKRIIHMNQITFNRFIRDALIQVPMSNKGAHAGKLSNISLGTQTNPIYLNTTNISEVLLNMIEVLRNKISFNKMPFIIIPSIVFNKIQTHPVAQKHFKGLLTSYGNDHTYKLNLYPSAIALISDRLPVYQISKNQFVYMMIAGQSNSYIGGYAELENSIREAIDYWGVLLRAHYATGGGMPNPSLYSIGFITIDEAKFN